MKKEQQDFGYDMRPDGQGYVILGGGMSGHTYAGWVIDHDTRSPCYGGRQPAALKRFNNNFCDPERPESRYLQREIRVLCRLNQPGHPGVVRFLGYFRDGSFPILATDLVQGDTLQHRINRAKQEGRIESADWIKAVIEWGANLARTLEYLKAQQVLHRDIKPLNIIIGERDQRPVLIDFGLGRIQNPEVTYHSGSPRPNTTAYASPEQLGEQSSYATGVPGPRVSHPSDVYNLGATLWAAVTGDPPAPGENLRGIDFPKAHGLGDVLRAMLMENPAERVDPKRLRASLEAIYRQSFDEDIFYPDAPDTGDIDVVEDDSSNFLPPFRRLNERAEIASRLVDQSAATVLSGQEVSRIIFANIASPARVSFTQALDILRKINTQPEISVYTYRLATAAEWAAAAGYSQSGSMLLSKAHSHQILEDATKELEWTTEIDRTAEPPPYPECARLSCLGDGGPRTEFRHRAWPKGGLRLVREAREIPHAPAPAFKRSSP